MIVLFHYVSSARFLVLYHSINSINHVDSRSLLTNLYYSRDLALWTPPSCTSSHINLVASWTLELHKLFLLGFVTLFKARRSRGTDTRSDLAAPLSPLVRY